ncbi:hypothetical protein EBZ38_02935 [bacterium]|nr:hypothetical protein [bacterium]
MSDYLNIDGINSIFDTTLNNELQDNIVEFLDWGLLQKGNYFNVSLNEISSDNLDYSLLRKSGNTNFIEGVAWEGFRKNWVWQSGITYNPAPIVGNNSSYPGISGIYINNEFYPTDTTGQYSYKIDYYNGRVVFDNPIPTGSKIQAEYSYKYINIIYANNLPWLREIQYRTLEPNPSFININKGDFDLPSEMRVQLPAIAVEVVPRRTMRGFQLGGGQWICTDVLFHCLAEDEITRNKLVDIVSFQNDKTIYMFDSNKIVNSGDIPLDYRGFPVSGALRYPDLIEKYKSKKMRFQNSTVQGMDLINTNFYAGIVRSTTEVIQTNI